MKTCNKCGVTRELTRFPPAKQNRDGKAGRCYNCRAAHRQASGETAKTVARTKANRQRLREVYNEWKSARGCAICGYNRCVQALDAHHIKEKNFEIARKLSCNISIDKLEEELKLCAILCANCHRELHAGVTSLE